MDDILALNNNYLNICTKDTYPKELCLSKVNIDNKLCPFLDLDIDIFYGKLNTKLHDKKDDLSLPIVNYPF